MSIERVIAIRYKISSIGSCIVADIKQELFVARTPKYTEHHPVALGLRGSKKSVWCFFRFFRVAGFFHSSLFPFAVPLQRCFIFTLRQPSSKKTRYFPFYSPWEWAQRRREKGKFAWRTKMERTKSKGRARTVLFSSESELIFIYTAANICCEKKFPHQRIVRFWEKRKLTI